MADTQTKELADIVKGLTSATTVNGTDNIVISVNGTLKTVTVAKLAEALINSIPAATTTAPGLLSAADKVKIDKL